MIGTVFIGVSLFKNVSRYACDIKKKKMVLVENEEFVSWWEMKYSQ